MPVQNSSRSMTFEDLYNVLMAEIEPDLMTYVIPTLGDLYRDESSEQRKERAERYARAFDAFLARFEDISKLWKKELKAYKESVVSELKKSAKAKDLESITQIEEKINQEDQ